MTALKTFPRFRYMHRHVATQVDGLIGSLPLYQQESCVRILALYVSTLPDPSDDPTAPGRLPPMFRIVFPD